ncbi:TIGR00341 family protein [Prevotella sp. kh1p2]|uniref:TIGR00341 family protein n=1 Tax=Prevotella sp. kh1p2 TaxID=1761883 RepID=UPI0008B3D130|nr:TIGR00341 family protein [Prevotella sp. kh1p2]SES96502.1 TIGR00341 family protein [Prevotella sp. kh1p2]SNU11341.1 TIGR00341 family protein [Prevotellaceae bacterium KH2P17]
MTEHTTTLWQVVKGYFNAIPDKENEEETISQISSGVAFHGANLWVLIFAIFIASLGLNVNSTAVIIGAMLISPLMGPIIGMGLAIGINDLELLKRSVKNYLVATGISALTATLYFAITPLNEAQSELLARTSPTLYDVLIALCGGAAGILALSTKGKGNVIPGVAIATALMPPLCTAGYGLAVGSPSYFFGALYLYFINTVFICLATFVGVRMLKFEHKTFEDPQRLSKVRRYIVAIVILTMLPATYMTINIIRQSVVDNNARRFVKNELVFKGTQIISQNLDEKSKTLNVVAVGRLITKSTIDSIRKQMDGYKMAGYKLNVIQGYQSDSLLLRSQTLNNATLSGEATNQKLVEQSTQIHDLESQLAQYTRYETMGKDIRNELRALYPTISTVTLTRVAESNVDSAAVRRYVMAVVGNRGRFSNTDRQKLQQWLKTRAKADSLRLIITQ